MDKYAIFTMLWINVAEPVDAATDQMVNSLVSWIGPKFPLCVVAYFLVSLLIASWSSDEQAFQRYFRQIILASVIFSLAANADTFNYYVAGIAHGTVDGISRAVANIFNKGQPINANGFDILASRAYSLGLAVYKDLPSWSLKTVALGAGVVAYWFLAFIGILVMFAGYLLSYVAMAFLIGIGPVFVALYFFPFSRRWFDGWLKNVVTAMLVQIFTVALGAMFIGVLTYILQQMSTGLVGSQAGQVDGGVVIGDLMMLDVTAIVCLIFAGLEGYIVYLAISIAGGAHAQLSAMPTPSWASVTGVSGGSTASHAPAPPYAPPPGAPLATPSPAPDYAFNRTVGSAP